MRIKYFDSEIVGRLWRDGVCWRSFLPLQVTDKGLSYFLLEIRAESNPNPAQVSAIEDFFRGFDDSLPVLKEAFFAEYKSQLAEGWGLPEVEGLEEAWKQLRWPGTIFADPDGTVTVAVDNKWDEMGHETHFYLSPNGEIQIKIE